MEGSGTIIKSSIPIAASVPVLSASTHRMANVCPGAMLKPLAVPLTAMRFAAALPSTAALDVVVVKISLMFSAVDVNGVVKAAFVIAIAPT